MANKTRENSIRKRKIQRRRRRLAVFRLLFLLVVLGLFSSAVLFVGYAVFNWGSHMYHEYQAMYRDYNQRQEAKRGTVDPKFDGYTNILILGLDEGVAEDGTDGLHADTVMLMSMVNESGRVRFIGIPPDTLIPTPGTGEQTRISTLYQVGGAPLMVRAVSSLLGISVHQYIAIDTQAFTDIINTLGGIDAYVEADMDYDDPEAGLSIHLKKGYQHMDGETAQKYLRYRGTELGDVGRVQRQQKFVRALYQKALQIDTVPKLPEIADICPALLLLCHSLGILTDIFLLEFTDVVDGEFFPCLNGLHPGCHDTLRQLLFCHIIQILFGRTKISVQPVRCPLIGMTGPYADRLLQRIHTVHIEQSLYHYSTQDLL